MFAAKSRVQGDAADEGGRVTLWLALDGRRVGSTGCGVHLFDLPANRIDSVRGRVFAPHGRADLDRRTISVEQMEVETLAAEIQTGVQH